MGGGGYSGGMGGTMSGGMGSSAYGGGRPSGGDISSLFTPTEFWVKTKLAQ